MTRPIRSPGLIALVAMTLLGVPPAAGQDTPDMLGLSAQEWKLAEGRSVRARLGFPAAAPQILAAARAGNPYAMAVMAGAYAVGSGVPKDLAQARSWADRAAASGIPFGLMVAAVFARSQGDDARYRLLLDRAAALGQASAQTERAVFLFEGGHGYARDFAEARRELELAGNAGVPRARTLQSALGINDGLARNIGGMPFFYSGRMTHIRTSFASSPCRTYITTSGGGAWEIDWVQTAPVKTTPNAVRLDGYIQRMSDKSSWTGLMISLGEDNNRYSPSQTRHIFSDIAADGRALNRICAPLRSDS